MGERVMAFIHTLVPALPAWMAVTVVLAAAVLFGLVAHSVILRLLTRAVGHLDLFSRSLVARTRGPSRLAFIIALLAAASSVAPLSAWQADALRRMLLLGFIVLVAWTISNALHIWVTVYLRRFELDAQDNLLARKHVTQTRILRRVADALIAIVAFAAMLMTFESVRQYGVSLLASAGAAGIIIGLALQTVLKNLFAGIQLAIAQPIRLDDVVIVEGEWGRVEEITTTYVVIKIWDRRRLIVPLSYFIEKPFQNWTRENASIIGIVMIYVDYTAPVEPLRCKARQIVEESPLWDKGVFSVQVTDLKESTMEVRVLASAGDAGRAFELSCLLREEIVAFLQAEYPHALPRIRMEGGHEAQAG